MGASLGDPKGGGYTGHEKGDDCRPSEAQEVFRHRFMGYVLSVTAFCAFCDKATVTLGAAYKPLAFLPFVSNFSTALSTYSDLKKTFQQQSACVDSGKYD